MISKARKMPKEEETSVRYAHLWIVQYYCYSDFFYSIKVKPAARVKAPSVSDDSKDLDGEPLGDSLHLPMGSKVMFSRRVKAPPVIGGESTDLDSNGEPFQDPSQRLVQESRLPQTMARIWTVMVPVLSLRDTHAHFASSKDAQR